MDNDRVSLPITSFQSTLQHILYTAASSGTTSGSSHATRSQTLHLAPHCRQQQHLLTLEIGVHACDSSRSGTGKSRTGPGQDRLKVEDQIYDLEYCRQNLKKEEVFTNPLRRSNYQNLQEEGWANSRVDRARRSRSQSPERNRRSQREQQTVDSAQRCNERSAERDTREAGGKQEVHFRVGGPTRVNDQSEQDNYRERNLETMTSANGSIVRVNRTNNVPLGYNLRNRITKKSRKEEK